MELGSHWEWSWSQWKERIAVLLGLSLDVGWYTFSWPFAGLGKGTWAWVSMCNATKTLGLNPSFAFSLVFCLSLSLCFFANWAHACFEWLNLGGALRFKACIPLFPSGLELEGQTGFQGGSWKWGMWELFLWTSVGKLTCFQSESPTSRLSFLDTLILRKRPRLTCRTPNRSCRGAESPTCQGLSCHFSLQH